MGKEGIMLRRSHVRTVILLIGGLGVLALVGQADSAKPLRPAATVQSPEEAQLKQLPPPAQQVGRPSKAEVLARCQQRPACRATLDAAQERQRPATPRPVAEASAVSVYLTPQNRVVSSPSSSLHLLGVDYWGPYTFSPYYATSSPTTENKPYVLTYFTAPATGWYIIDVRAGSAAAKLRHHSGPIIETWDLGSVPCSGGICDYVTMEYLQQGFHGYYFWSPTKSYSFYSVSIESYP
jgi:hypothetical protein